MNKTTHIRTLFVVWLCLLTSLASAKTAPVAHVQSATLSSDDEGLTVQLVVSAPSTHSCDELDVLVRLSRENKKSTSMLDVFASLDTQWQHISLEDGDEDDVMVGMTELSPIRPTVDVLVQQRSEELFIRYRSARTIEAGSQQTISIGPLAYADDNKENPLTPTAVVIGHVASPLTNADIESFVQGGPLGILVLLRTVGLEGKESTRRVRAEEFSENAEFVGSLQKSLKSALLKGADPTPLATAVRLRVLGLIDPDAYVQSVVPFLKSSHTPASSQALGALLEQVRDNDPFGWEALAFVLPSENAEDPMVAVMGAAVDRLPPNDVAQLMVRIDGLEKTQSGKGWRFASTAGGSWLRGMEKWTDEELGAVLDRMIRWRVSSVVLGFFSDGHWKDWTGRFSREERLKRAIALTQASMPLELVRLMGDVDSKRRTFAHDVVVAGGASASKVVRSELERLGHPLASKDKVGLPQQASVLQGQYLAPFAEPYIDEAQRVLSLRTLGKQGSCYDPLLRGRTEVHPALAYPPRLWARCRAEGANELLQSGQVDRALKLIQQAVADAPNDAEVVRWLRPVQMGKLRQLVGEGKVAKAQEYAMKLDPKREQREIQTILEQLSALGAPIKIRTERVSLLRLIFASFLMVLGVFGFAGRTWSIRRSMAFARTLSEDEPTDFRSSGRRIVITDHAMLIQRGLGYRLVPWAETRLVCRVPASGGRSEGLMFWFASGDGFFMRTSGLSDASAVVELSGTYLKQAGVHIQELESDDAEMTAENEYMVDLLTRRNRVRVIGQAIAIGIGVVGTVLAMFADTAGTDIALSQWLQAIGIGLGGGLAAWVAVDILIPMSRG